MDFSLDDDGRLLLDALGQMAERHGQAPTDHVGPWYSGDTLRGELVAGGFLDIAREEGCGPLQAALVVDVIARQTAVAEVAISVLVLPQLQLAPLPGPVAVVDAGDGRLGKPVRFLAVASHALVDTGDELVLLPVAPGAVEAIPSFMAYPMGRLVAIDLGGGQALGRETLAAFRLWRQVALAVELSANMMAALDQTVAYVKERHAFGRAIGSFQAVQHRLAMCAQQAHSARWLALRAADSGDPAEAAIALAYAQEVAGNLYWDTHQFTGAIGLTFEYPLHYWTLRLRALQGELGGALPCAAAAARVAFA